MKTKNIKRRSGKCDYCLTCDNEITYGVNLRITNSKKWTDTKYICPRCKDYLIGIFKYDRA